MKTFERRMGVQRLEVRESSDALTLTGYASTFDEPYDMGWYWEKVSAGAFSRTLGQSPDVRLLVNHGDLPLARTTSGTLTLDQDSKGLLSRAELDLSDPDVQRLVPKMKRGDLNQMSFGFRVVEQDWSPDYDQRTLKVLDLHDGDVSVVTYPANPGTSASVRAAGRTNLEAVTGALRALEQRDASQGDIVAVLTRALGMFEAVDVAEGGTPASDVEPDDDALQAAHAATETRRRLLQLL